MKGWVLAVMALTCVALVIGMFLGMMFMLSELVRTNQLIYMLGALAAAALCAVYGRCLIKILD